MHVKSKRGFGDYEIAVGGNTDGEGGEVTDSDIFTYDVNKDEHGADVIVNFKSLQESEAQAAAK